MDNKDAHHDTEDQNECNHIDESETNLEESDVIQESSEDKINLLEQKINELNDMYFRSEADKQNIQKRNQEELKKAREYAISSFAKDLVSVKDCLEMALKDQSGNFEMLKMGVDLTLKQLVQVFETQKIKEISPNVSDKLDPHLHQAMSTVEVDGQESNTIVAVMQKGYILHDRVLRPAMVSVAK